MKFAIVILTTLLTLLSIQPVRADGPQDIQPVAAEETTLVAGRFRRGGHRGRFRRGGHRGRFRRGRFRRGRFRRGRFQRRRFGRRRFFRRGRFGHRHFRRRRFVRHHFPSFWIHFPLHSYGWYTPFGSSTVITRTQTTESTVNPASDSPEWVGVEGVSERLNLAQRVALALDRDLDSSELSDLEVAQVENRILLRGEVASVELLDQVIASVSAVPGVEDVDASEVTVLSE